MKFSGEPDLSEMLSDPIVQALMRADGWDQATLRDRLRRVREGAGAVRHAPRVAAIPRGVSRRS